MSETHRHNGQAMPTSHHESQFKWMKIKENYLDSDTAKKSARKSAIKQLRNEFELAFDPDTETLYRYDDDTGIYRDDAKKEIRQRLAQHLGEHFTTREQSQIFHLLTAQNYIRPDKFRGPPKKICVANGVLDVTTPTSPVLNNHDSEYTFRRHIPVEYDAEAGCPRFKEYLDDVVYNHDRKKLQEFTGYCLHHWGMPFNRALMITGPHQSGKSTYFKVIEELLGPENVSHESLQRLANQRFAPAQLYGKYVNIRADLDSSVVKHEGLFKELAAGDTITAERKNEDPFRFPVTQKQLYATNQVPELKNGDDAFHERWLHVQFPETIPRGDREQQIEKRLTSDTELSGILNWALEGYARIMDQGGFTGERSLERKRNLWQSQGDSISQFIDNVIEFNSKTRTPESDVYDAYQDFSKSIGCTPKPKQTLTKRLNQDHDVDQRRPAINSNSQQIRCYAGVSLTEYSGSENENEES